MPYTYLSPTDHVHPTGNPAVDSSLDRLRALTNEDYRVAKIEVRRFLRRPLELFTVYVPCFGYEFGIPSFGPGLQYTANEPVAVAFLEGLWLGRVDEATHQRELLKKQSQSIPWLRDWIRTLRTLSANPELTAEETRQLNFFLDELDKAWKDAVR
jgi:hypothetical protein